jgi:hypothetical protein
VHAGVHFLAEDLLGALHGQRGDLLAQGVTGLHGLLLGFGAGGGDDLVRLFGRAALGLLDDRLRATLGVGQQGSGFRAGLGQFLLDLLVGGLQF